jgi:hypothetical protein
MTLKTENKESGPVKSPIDAISADLTGSMPEPSNNADMIAQNIQAKQELNNPDAKKEKRGRKGKSRADVINELENLNVTVDETRTDAQLKRDLSNIKRRNKKAGAEPKSTGSSIRGVPPSAEDDQKLQRYHEMGEFMAGNLFGLCSAIDEAEWTPTQQERDSIRRGFKDVAEYYEMGDMHPLLGLTISIVAYALPRIKKPKTSDKLAALKAWFTKKAKK